MKWDDKNQAYGGPHLHNKEAACDVTSAIW
jgi:hypothetical protein